MATLSRAARRGVEVEDGPKRGADYTRYSTEEQGSTAEQKAINAELADENDIELVASFSDEGLSRSLSDRPGLVDLFQYLEAHPDVQFVIVNELERLTAGIEQRHQVVSLCKRLNVAIVTEDIGVINPHDEDKMHEADQRAVTAKGEVLKVRRRTRRSLRAKVKSRTSVVMRPAYGVRMVPLVTPDGIELPSGMAMIDASGKRTTSGRIELHPDEYPWLVQMFGWSAEGVGLGEIARRLNSEGIPTKTGKGPWSSSTVVGILDNPFYKGEMTWGLQETRRDENGKRYTVIRRKGDPGRIDMESPLGAIIDPATWDLAQSHREATAGLFNHRERQRQARQVLDGRVYCLRCGHKMYGRNNANTAARKRGVMNWAYVCHSSRPAFKARPGLPKCTEPHTISVAAIFKALADFQSPDSQITVARGRSGVDAAKRLQLDRIIKAEAAIDRAEDLALEGDISKEKLRSTRAEQQQVIRDAKERYATLGETQDAVIEPIQTAVVDNFAELVTMLTDEEVPLATRVAWLDRFGLEKLYVDKPLLRLQLRG